jgi:hypothetical protein
MRTFTTRLLTSVIAACSFFLLSQDAFAQKAIPTMSDIVSVIVGDTTAAGARINTEYILERGGVYFALGQIQSQFDLTITAAGDESLADPQIIVLTDESGNYSAPFKPYKNLTLEGLYMSGINSAGVQIANLIQTGTTGVKLTLINCRIDSVQTRALLVDQNDCSVIAKDCYVSNIAGGSHSGRFIDARETILDTIIIQNCTFYNIMHTLINRFSAGQEYFKFDHNTVYNIMRTPLRIDVCPDIVMTNNLFLQTGFAGYLSIWEEAFQSGDMGDRDEWVRIEIWPLDSSNAFPGETQKINCKYNNFWLDPAIEAAFPDTIYPYRTLDFDFEKEMIGADTLTWLSENVNFVKAPECDYLAMAQECWVDGSPQTNPGFNGSGAPFDFSYSTASASYTAGEDGLPLGDLNWFPSKKAEWVKLTDVTDFYQAVPSRFSVEQNYPNPFNPSTVIKYSVPSTSDVVVKVYNVLGKEIATLVNVKQQAAGEYSVRFDAHNLASGVYFYTMTAGNFNVTKKMIFMK